MEAIGEIVVDLNQPGVFASPTTGCIIGLSRLVGRNRHRHGNLDQNR
jgi:hypothetical protein